MPSPNVSYLLDFESAYEDALTNYFANLNVGGQTFAQVVTPRSNLSDEAFLQTPRLQIRCGISGLGQTGSGWQENQYPLSNVTENYYSYYQLSLELTVATSRSNNSQSHGLLRGGVRASMLSATAIMNNSVLPYYQTAEVIPLTSSQGIDPQNDEITSQMTYQLDVFVPPSSFPNS